MQSDENRYISAILSLDDYEEAADALLNLKHVNPEKSKELAIDILNRHRGDEYLQAFAFDLTYHAVPDVALEMSENIINNGSVILLKTVIENVTVDSQFLNDRPKLRNVVQKINKRIMTLSPEEMEHISDTLKWYRNSFALD